MFPSPLRTATLLGCAASMLGGCAPVASFRAPLPMPTNASDQVTIGAGVDGEGSLLAPGGCTTAAVGASTGCYAGVSGQIWGGYRTGHLELTGVAFLGSSVGVGGGGGVRYYLVDQADVQLGVDGQLGWLWADLGLPAGVRVSDAFWIYTRPSVTASLAPHAQLPVGVALRLSDALAIMPEVGVVAGEYHGPLELSFYVGLGLSWRMGIDRRPPVELDSGRTPVTAPPPVSPVPPPPPALP